MMNIPLISDIIRFAYLRSLLSLQFKDRSKIEKIHFTNLKRVVSYAYYHVPFYRRYWRMNGFHPKDLKSTSDISLIPPINKDIVKENYNSFVSKQFKQEFMLLPKRSVFLYMRSTSGTSGNKLKIVLDYSAKYYTDAVYMRELINIGYSGRENIGFLWIKKYDDSILRKLGFFKNIYIPIHWTEERQLEFMMRVKPEFIYYYPSALYIISRIILKENIDIGFRPKAVITHAELLTEKMRRKIENAFDAKVYDQYGSNEVGDISFECSKRNGYHINYDSVHVEITDKNFDEVDYGETGKVLLTSLVNRAMPLIRYEIGDYATKADYDQINHDCKINLPVYIKRIEGRYEHSLEKKNKIITQRILLERFQDVLDPVDDITKYQIFINPKNRIAKVYIETNKDKQNKIIEELPKNIEGFRIKPIFSKIKKNEKTGKIILIEIKNR